MFRNVWNTLDPRPRRAAPYPVSYVLNDTAVYNKRRDAAAKFKFSIRWARIQQVRLETPRCVTKLLVHV
eukprot:SAG31_NODE_2464_length_5655_cov_2.777898_9_plen_69_part_00